MKEFTKYDALDLAEALTSLGLSHGDFARILGCTRVSVNRWCNKRVRPHLMAQRSIIEALNHLEGLSTKDARKQYVRSFR